MEKNIQYFIIMIASLFIGSAMIYFIWPIIIPMIFPGLVKNNFITVDLTYWQSMGFYVLCDVLFNTTHRKNDN
jgi:hypothetical protein